MSKIAKLRQEIASLQDEGKALLAAAQARGDEDLNEAETARFTEIEADLKAKRAEVKAEETRLERLRLLDGDSQRRSAALSTTVGDSDPARTGGFVSIAEFATAVRTSALGGGTDQRLSQLAAAPANTMRGGGTGGEGYMLPDQFREGIMDVVEQMDQLTPLLDTEQTSSRRVQLMKDETTPWGANGVQAYWDTELGQMTSSKLHTKGDLVELHNLYVFAGASEDLLEDAPLLASRLTRKAAAAIAYKRGDAYINGDGVGKPIGILSAASTVEQTKETGQAAATFTAANAAKMYARLQRIPGDQPQWWINQDVLPQLITMTLGDRPIWMPPNGFADAPGGFLLGYPVKFLDQNQTVGTKGDIILASPKGYYAPEHVAGLKYAESMHLWFDQNARAFRWTIRVGGQPHLSAAIGPAKGSTTRSHFITLATRS